jgi:hypothetical protein
MRPAGACCGSASRSRKARSARPECRGGECRPPIFTSTPLAAAGELGGCARAGVPVIEINPEPTVYSDRVLSLAGRAGELLPRLVD